MEEKKTTTMEKEKLEILNMLRDGKITSEEALKLLDAIQLENVKFISDSTKSANAAETKIKIITNAGSNESTTKLEDVKFLKTILDKAESNNSVIKIDTDGNSTPKTLSTVDIDKILQVVFNEIDSNKQKKENSIPKKITIEKPDGSVEVIEL